MTITEGIFSVLHFLLKIVLIPVILILTILHYMFSFGGGIICWISSIIGVIFFLGGITIIIMDPHNTTMIWQSFVIGMIFGGIPMFFMDLISEILSGLINLLSEI